MEEAQVEIVSLQERHVAELAALEAVVFTDPWSEGAYRELLTHPYCHYLVAELDGRVVGFAGMTVSLDEGDIDKVMVAPEMRRRGMADRLLESLMAWGAELGVKDYTLEVRRGNAPAIALYEKHGFVSEGIRPGYYSNPREDAMILWKRS